MSKPRIPRKLKKKLAKLGVIPFIRECEKRNISFKVRAIGITRKDLSELLIIPNYNDNNDTRTIRQTPEEGSNGKADDFLGTECPQDGAETPGQA
jgi:hypothetical protein